MEEEEEKGAFFKNSNKYIEHFLSLHY